MAPVLIPRGDNRFLIVSMADARDGKEGREKKGEASEGNRRRPYMDLMIASCMEGLSF